MTTWEDNPNMSIVAAIMQKTNTVLWSPKITQERIYKVSGRGTIEAVTSYQQPNIIPKVKILIHGDSWLCQHAPT